IGLLRGLNGLGIYRRRLPRLDLKDLDTATRERVAREGSPDAMTKRYAKPWADLRVLPGAVYFQEFIEVSSPLPPLSGIKLPVLGLISSGRFISDPVVNRRILEALPKGRIVEVPARHWIPTECPDQMRTEIEAWCRELRLSEK
ncbi:MAG TPA: alpha/beta hydrolase, partial [Nitrospiria bacterium]